MRVGASRSPSGQLVPIAWVQEALDRLATWRTVQALTGAVATRAGRPASGDAMRATAGSCPATGAVETSLGTFKVRVCSKEDLITMKRAAGRPQDLVDLEELRAKDWS